MNARSTALGGSFAAVNGDITAIDYNPAGLSGLLRTDVRATYIDYLEDTSLQALSIGFPVSMRTAPRPARDGEFPQDRLAVGLQYRLFRANDTARSNTGVDLSEFDVRDQMMGLGFAYPVFSRLAIGASGKYIGNKLQDKSANNYAFDTGLQAKFAGGWSAGLAIQNIGGSKALDKAADPLPLLVRSGVAYRMPNVLVVADLTKGRDAVTRESGGVEWSLNRYLALRAGLFHDTTLQFSGGLGIQISGPQKNGPSASSWKPAKPAAESGQAPSNLTQQVIGQSVTRLMKKVDRELFSAGKPVLAIFPLNSTDKDGRTVTDILTQEFIDRNEFTLADKAAIDQVLNEPQFKKLDSVDNAHAVEMGQILAARVVLVGSVDRYDGKYTISTRLLDTENAEVLATDYTEIANEDFHQKPRQNLGTADAAKSSSSSTDSPFSHIDLGLDYGLTSHPDLGITHTVTLRILY